MNPVDYFDAAADTVKRALGEHLIPPSVQHWRRSHIDHYAFVYGGRVYRITPRSQIPGVSRGFNVYVEPGDTLPRAWINEGVEQATEAYHITADTAAYAAGKHAVRYGSVR